MLGWLGFLRQKEREIISLRANVVDHIHGGASPCFRLLRSIHGVFAGMRSRGKSGPMWLRFHSLPVNLHKARCSVELTNVWTGGAAGPGAGRAAAGGGGPAGGAGGAGRI